MTGVVEGEGWDHVAWRVERPDGVWIEKRVKDGPADAAAASAAREAAVMRVVGTALGRWVAADASSAGDTLTYRRIEGTPLTSLLAEGRVDDVARHRLAHQLGQLITELAIDVTDHLDLPVDDGGWVPWFEEWEHLVATIADHVSADVLARVRALPDAPRPPAPTPAELVFTHNDLGGEHVLVDPSGLTISGIIDWTDAAIADPAADVGRLLRDLGPQVLDPILDGMGAIGERREALGARAWCYARLLIVEDLAYALVNRPSLVPFEQRRLAVLFAEVA
ncbi:MAG: phosphotransferase [Desertimonas sp.]